ncbi:DUF4352 domain-containing protein [Streptomyces sp. NBC_01352]|uniref:DUF4352 domain-containing protein n=1 Tax=Streptomyces sp. NBC_01352 TaxID=2903834 RepID=UPI002E2FA28D|nr:DUF4352 domain-containing protein [Streptomyces sp. NBC_01352]
MTDSTPPPPPGFPPAPAPKKNRTNAIIIGAAAAIIAAIVTTGIVVVQSRDDDSSTGSTVTAASPEPSSASSTEPTATPRQEAFNIGDTADIETAGLNFSAGVLNYEDKGITGLPEMLGAGQKWAVVEAKVCNKGTEVIAVSTYPWSLAYADGARVESAGMNAGDLPQPLYPMDAKVKGGDCVRGNIVFQVPKEGRPERILYSPSDVAEPVEWSVTKA